MPTVDELLGSEPAKPTADSLLGPEPYQPSTAQTDLTAGTPIMAGPSMDAFFTHSPVGRLLDAAGEGAKQAWGSSDLGLSDQTSEALKKAGIFSDVQKGQGGILRAFNEAFIRSAAMGADAVVFAGHSVDPYNGKCLRSSAGSIFSLPVVVDPDAAAVVSAMRDHGIEVLATALDASGDIRSADLAAPPA